MRKGPGELVLVQLNIQKKRLVDNIGDGTGEFVDVQVDQYYTSRREFEIGNAAVLSLRTYRDL